MPQFNCVLCNFSSKSKYNYERHLETNKHKNAIIRREKNLHQLTSININLHQLTSIDINEKIKKNKNKSKIKNIDKDKNTKIVEKYIKTTCKYCNSSVIQNNLRRHYRTTCLKIPKYDKELIIDKYNNHKKRKNNELVNYNKVDNKENITNIMSNNNITNNIQQNFNIRINPLGKEDLSFLTDNDKIAILMKRYMGVPELIKKIHNNPCNHNFFLPNVNKKIMAYLNKDNKLEYDNYNEVCDQIVEDNIQRFDEIFNEIGNKLNSNIKSRVNKVVQDNNTSEIINKKYIEDIKFYLMNKSKEYKKDINEFISNLTEKIEIENNNVLP